MTYTISERALGYAEGREDASGVATVSPTEAPGCLVFAEAYAARQGAFNAQVKHRVPCIQAAYDDWQAAAGRPEWADLTMPFPGYARATASANNPHVYDKPEFPMTLMQRPRD